MCISFRDIQTLAILFPVFKKTQISSFAENLCKKKWNETINNLETIYHTIKCGRNVGYEQSNGKSELDHIWEIQISCISMQLKLAIIVALFIFEMKTE